MAKKVPTDSKVSAPASGRTYAHKPHLAKRAIQERRHWSRIIMLHPRTVFCLLVVGVLLFGLSIRAIADDLQVNATVPAAPLTTGATIADPANGQIFTSKPITVSGSCPDESYVKLYRNGMFSGIAPCQSLAFSIQTDLFTGLNTLQAQAYNSTDQAGPVTPTVDVTYTPPVVSTPPSSPPATAPSSPAPTVIPDASSTYAPSRAANQPIQPLLLWTDYKFSVVPTGGEFRWTLHNQFGSAPYVAGVDWGDGKTSQQNVPGHEDFEIRHRYEASGYYKIVVTSRDATGQTAMVQLAALVKTPGSPGTIGSITSGGTSAGSAPQQRSFRWLWLAWPTYAVVSLMVVSFWLGERREYLQLILQSKHRLRHQH